MKRKNFFIEFLIFLWSKKVYWLLPVLFFLFALIFFIMVGTSPASPFVYTIF